MSWLFSQVLVEEYSGGGFLDGELSALSSGNNTQQAYCVPGKMTDFSRLSRFGMMFKPLTESLGEELLTSYLAGFHVKTFQSQVKVTALTESGQECGERWQGLLAKLDLNSYSWKTPQCSLLEDSELSLQTWPNWGLMLNGVCWEQTMPDYLTEGSEYGCWLPTPTVSMKNGCSSKRYRNSAEYRGSMPMEWIRTSKDCEQYLDPDYAELVMDFPDKWTDLRPLEMHKYQEWLGSHGTYLKED